MLSQERFRFIMSELEKKRTVTVTELAKRMSTSESTIRRDLCQLDKLGKLEKVHGGATIIEERNHTQEEAVSEKASQNVEEKRAIARYAASLIRDDDFIFLDAGTTTEMMIDYMEHTKAVVVTNGVGHASKLAKKGIRTHMLGGELRVYTEAVVGTTALEQLTGFNFTKAFVGANGISVRKGYTTPDIEEAHMKKTALAMAASKYILADHTKFSRVTSVTFGEIKDACMITDHIPDTKYEELTEITEVKL